MPSQNFYFLSVELLSFQLPRVTVMPETGNSFFPLPPKLQTHSVTVLQPLGSPLSHTTIFTVCLFEDAGSTWVNETII